VAGTVVAVAGAVQLAANIPNAISAAATIKPVVSGLFIVHLLVRE
jgi:hypothetical protein